MLFLQEKLLLGKNNLLVDTIGAEEINLTD